MSKELNVIEYYDRASAELCRERVMGDTVIKWAYQTLSGQLLAPLFFGTSFFSRVLGWYFNSSHSRGRIAATISDLGIEESEFVKTSDEFVSFNDFFTRKLKKESRPHSNDAKTFLSPADGRLLVYDNIEGDSCLKIKGVEDSINNLFEREFDEYDNGMAAVIRLCPADYHRFHFPCSGKVTETVNLKGAYHAVNPIALAAKKRIFCLNKRTYTILETEQFGRIAIMEVGAFGVAGIHQTFSGREAKRMREKGYFDFGGSTILILFQKESVAFDRDLIENSKKGIETLVRAGEQIASARN